MVESRAHQSQEKTLSRCGLQVILFLSISLSRHLHPPPHPLLPEEEGEQEQAALALPALALAQALASPLLATATSAPLPLAPSSVDKASLPFSMHLLPLAPAPAPASRLPYRRTVRQQHAVEVGSAKVHGPRPSLNPIPASPNMLLLILMSMLVLVLETRMARPRLLPRLRR